MNKLLGEPTETGLGRVRTHLDLAAAAAPRVTDGEVLQLCTLRMAMLLGHPLAEQGKERGVSQWPTSDAFNETQKACLAFTEQFVVDVSALDDATATAVSDKLGEPGLANFANALLTMEQRLRLELIWEQVL